MRVTSVSHWTGVLVGLVVWALPMPALAQEVPKNLQYFAADIPRDELIQRMREFSFALDVRCQYCHAGGDGISFDGVVFESDDKLAKRKARYMLEMVDEINTSLLASVPGREAGAARVQCATCHRGLAVPKTLAQTLTEVIDTAGPAAAVASYRELRADTMVSGKYNFGEWEINELARELREAGDTAAAVAMLEMNADYYSESIAIDMALAELHVERDERDLAIARYRMALETQPENERVQRQLAELEGR